MFFSSSAARFHRDGEGIKRENEKNSARLDTKKGSFTMALKWADLGEGEYVAKDEAGRVLAKVMELNLDPARRYWWYLDLPDSPEDGIEPSIFDKYELLY